ncbi:MAG: LysR family transcriptional regulator [Alphaproteobacteria bacterium]|nr:LysR family transcriptional regulator [Alphaproteobacteria bacterium]
MNIKNYITLIRGILYVQEIIRCKSINRAAEENNIKAPNLSLIINNFEKEIGAKLFKRSSQGCIPTKQGRRVAELAADLREQIQKIGNWHENTCPKNRVLNIYISPNMELTDWSEFEKNHPTIKLNFVEEDIMADVKISNVPPTNPREKYTELHIGSSLKQKIWVCCNERNPKALEFFDFIIEKLLLLYGQSAL